MVAFEVPSLLAVDCGANGVMLKPSNVQHASIGCSVLSGPLFCAGETVDHYFTTLVYPILIRQKQAQKTHSNGVMYVTEENVLHRRLNF